MKPTKVLEIAKAEVGYLEKKSNKNLDSKTANAGSKNYTKYEVPFSTNGVFWCCYFIEWIFWKACSESKDKLKKVLFVVTGACETLRSTMNKNGRYWKRGTGTVKAGDMIFFSGTRHAGANHIGIVYKVENGYVYTIEGNTSGASGVVDNGGGVAKKKYSKSNSRIMGYARPVYDEAWELPSRGYFTIGDGIDTNCDMKPAIKVIQKIVGATQDGEYGANTYRAVKAWKNVNHIGDTTGNFGKGSAKGANLL